MPAYKRAESKKTVKLDKELYKLGVDSFAVVGNQMQSNGQPDRYYSGKELPGGSAWVEFKDDGKLSDKQYRKIDRLRRRGVLAVVYCFKKKEFYTHDKEHLLYSDHTEPKRWLSNLKSCGHLLGCYNDGPDIP